jgi:hypothetical protein
VSALPLTLESLPTLADVAERALDDGLAVGSATCVWCGGLAIAAVADRWTARVVLRCAECGSELEGLGHRRVREARA